MPRLTILIMAVSFSLKHSKTDIPPTAKVTLQQGMLEGTKETARNDKIFYSFLGIPYAKPPVGEFRFQDPSPPDSWTSLRVSKKPPKCPQPEFILDFSGRKPLISGYEDCLYLNVYTPMPYEADLPVMVFIHGGGFLIGDAFIVGGTPKLLLQKDVVLVSIQYRLGTLGFMSTGDSVLPGNLGLKDQSFALKWVQENIQKFGGNPKRVTIFGQSAGGASAHLHIMLPHSRGLFQQVILQSGSAIYPWVVRDDHQQIMLEGARSLGCPGTNQALPDSAKIFKCLKEETVESLVKMALPANVEMVFPFYMTPRVDGDILPDHPAQLLKEGKYQKVDLMAGVCQNEGASYLAPILNNKTAAERLSNDLGQLAKIIIGMDHEDNLNYLMKRSFYHYAGDVDINEGKAEEIEKFFAHYSTVFPNDITGGLHARDFSFGKHAYMYEVQHRGQFSFTDLAVNTTEITEKWVAHTDEQQYIFNDLLSFINVNHPADIFLSDIMVSLWTNFARTGNPTPTYELGFKWEPMTSEENLRYLSLTPAPEMKEDNRQEIREFWKNMPIKMSKVLFPDKFASDEKSF